MSRWNIPVRSSSCLPSINLHSLGVTITKRGNSAVMAGSQMRYDFTVANTSNVPLESFFWHDRIPTDIANATVLSTGTYKCAAYLPHPL